MVILNRSVLYSSFVVVVVVVAMLYFDYVVGLPCTLRPILGLSLGSRPILRLGLGSRPIRARFRVKADLRVRFRVMDSLPFLPFSRLYRPDKPRQPYWFFVVVFFYLHVERARKKAL